MKTEILKIKGDWEEVVNDCRATVKKPELGREPSAAWKRKILISEHDPIRDIIIKFRWKNIKYWIAMHYKTHIWRSRTDSQRNDRQDRCDRNKAPQDAPVDFIGDPNTQHMIDSSRKRLCRQAADETREYWEDLKAAVHEPEPEVSDVMVPNCVYRCGCPELKTCGYWDYLIRVTDGAILTSDIQERYRLYNREFWMRWYEEHGGVQE